MAEMIKRYRVEFTRETPTMSSQTTHLFDSTKEVEAFKQQEIASCLRVGDSYEILVYRTVLVETLEG